ncbi:MAG: hypothetical protein MUE40_14590 [Anaerolineae bacterium]|nr:hypothetical protein [Anaerolineae bacterium]
MLLRSVLLAGLLLLAPAVLAQPPADDVTACERGALNSVALIAEDMRLPHESLPHGVPLSYDWQPGPRIGYGNEPPPDFSAFIVWGQVYEAAEGNPARNTRVQLRDIEAYYLSATTGRWYLLQFARRVEGAAYVEDFVDNVSVPADVREEAGGSISVTAGDGYNFHFWSELGRVTIDPTDIAGIFTTVQARLIVDDPARPDDREQARYVLSVGGDYWRSLAAEWSADWTTVGDAAIGRFRYVTPEWQSFNMTTVSAAVLCANPPPLR